MRDAESLARVSSSDMRIALDRVLASPVFARGGRLSDFLAYVVGEEIAGRGDAIRGKTIAQDLYGRMTTDNGDPDNVVRVDARRLRQELDRYYATAGSGDKVRIHLDPGSYRPRFEVVAEGAPLPRTGGLVTAAPYAGLFGLGAVVGGLLALVVAPGPSPDTATTRGPERVAASPEADGTGAAQRKAVWEKSPASLEAINLAEQAQRMIYPIFDLPRQELLTSVFDRVIEIDPGYFGGHAGLAHVLSVRAILSPDPATREDLLSRANAAAHEAVQLAPAQPLTQTALAWSALAARDYDEANRFAQLAAELAPDDGQILDLIATVALFSGDYDRAIAAANGGKPRQGSNQRFANRNIFAVASYHLGNYRDCIDALEAAAAYGDPLSAPSLAYEAAALAAVGRHRDASRTLDQLVRAWPDAPLETIFHAMHRDRARADDVLDRLRELGWSAQRIDDDAASLARADRGG